MASHAVYPGIIERVVHVEGRPIPHHVARCSCPGCTHELAIPMKGMRKPPAMIHKALRYKHWTVANPKHGVFYCPIHGAQA